MRRAALGRAGLNTSFSVIEEAVNKLFFSHRNSRGGTLPARSYDGQYDEEGWLWRAVLGGTTPSMPTTLADAFNARLDSDDSPVLLAVAPTGSGKSFGAWQLGTSRYVDLLNAMPTFSLSVYDRWKDAIMSNELTDDELLQPGEVISVQERNSRQALYHTWILLHAYTFMRRQCGKPSDWLFFQRHRTRLLIAGYHASRDVCLAHGLPYEALRQMQPEKVKGQAAVPQAVLVVDNAAYALPTDDRVVFARFHEATPQSTCEQPPQATGAALAGVASTQCGAAVCAGAKPGADAGTEPVAGAGAGSGAGAKPGDDTGLLGADRNVGQPETLHSGLLGCLLQGAMAYSRKMIATASSISLAQSNLKDFVQLGGNNATHPCMAPSDFPQLSPDACASYIRFHSRLLGVELDDSLMDVCNQIQGVWLSVIAALATVTVIPCMFVALQAARSSCTTSSWH